MGWIDRIFGRKAELEGAPIPSGASMGDARAVDRYERMLRTAPSDVIERAHVEAFERLTPAQLDLLFERLAEEAERDDERPANTKPAALARSATRLEHRRPGVMTRTLTQVPGGVDASTWIGLSVLDAVTWYAISSVAWTAWSASDMGSVDATGDMGAGDIGSVDMSDGGGFWDFGL